MKWLALVAGCVVGWRYVRSRYRQRGVSHSWLVDNERRAWGGGVEQSPIRSWPIQRDDL